MKEDYFINSSRSFYQLRLTAGRNHWHWSQGGRSVRALKRYPQQGKKPTWVLFSEIRLDALEVEDFV